MKKILKNYLMIFFFKKTFSTHLVPHFNYPQSAITISILGLSLGLVGTFSIASKTSIPFDTYPNTTCFPFK